MSGYAPLLDAAELGSASPGSRASAVSLANIADPPEDGLSTAEALRLLEVQ